MEKKFPNGMWPVMLTPLQQNGDVDYPALEELINWYIKEGSSGLFAVCQSSEMFYLSMEEREELTRFIKKAANGRVPVISSGHVSYSLHDQIQELNGIAEAGADAGGDLGQLAVAGAALTHVHQLHVEDDGIDRL